MICRFRRRTSLTSWENYEQPSAQLACCWRLPSRPGSSPSTTLTTCKPWLSERLTVVHFVPLSLFKVGICLASAYITSSSDPYLSRSLDVVNIMAYDYHGAWDTFVHHNAPVRMHPLDAGQEEYAFFNVVSNKRWLWWIWSTFPSHISSLD